MTRVGFAAGILLICSTAIDAQQTIKYEPTAGVQTFAVREPVLRIKPGAVVETRTFSRSGDYYEGKGGPWPGEVGPFFESTDTTFKGSFPINTDGGQLSCGQFIAGSSGTQHVTEAVRQVRGMAGERQVARHDLCVVNVNGGSPSQEATMVLGSANAL